MVEGILFEQVEDSRQDWKVKHSISEILTVVMCGVSAGERSIYGIREFARLKEQWLRNVIGLKLPNGLPSYDTVRRVLGILDPKQFQSVFIRWIEEELDIPAGSYVSLDGKTLRGSGLKEVGIDLLHLLHAYSHELGVVIGQMECSSEKTNEIPISKKLIEALKIKETIITADALLCQKEIVKKIAKDNDYILALKGNHPLMEQEVKEFFLSPATSTRSVHTTFDKGHGRIERRIYTLDTNIGWFEDKMEWKHLAAFGMVESIVTRKGKECREIRYFITSVTDVKQFAKGVRSHWAIENNLHWCLDVLFSDDECTVLDRNAAENLAIIRRIVYNRIKMLSKMDTLSMGKRACIYDDNFRAQILFSC